MALITGGVRGIGRDLALSLARDGWRLGVCYRRSHADAQSLREALAALGVSALVVPGDVSDAARCDSLVTEVEAALGPVRALIHAAGPFHRTPLWEETPEAWRETFDANLHALFYLARRVAPGMIARGDGRVVAFGLAGASKLSPAGTIAGYAIAKAGVVALVRALARSLAPHGVTANVVSPGYLSTGGIPEEDLAARAGQIPAGYVGAPGDATAVVRFLLSDAARYVNGAEIPVSGAWGV